MKTKLFTLVALFLISNTIFGQLQVDAGNDTAFCISNLQDSISIGGNPTASGGKEPYSYLWTSDSRMPIRYLLNDSTIANPVIVSSSDKIKFKVRVTDDLGDVNYDSINIRAVQIMQTMIYFGPQIDQGDTIDLPHNYFEHGIEPYHYYWYPNYNISDTNISNPKAWPDTSTTYYVYVVDSIGCKSGVDNIDVFVKNSLKINSISSDFRKSSVFPNPLNSLSKIYFQTENKNDYCIKIINASGQVIIEDHYNSNFYDIGQKINLSGTYLYLILENNHIISSGKFIKE